MLTNDVVSFEHSAPGVNGISIPIFKCKHFSLASGINYAKRTLFEHYFITAMLPESL